MQPFSNYNVAGNLLCLIKNTMFFKSTTEACITLLAVSRSCNALVKTLVFAGYTQHTEFSFSKKTTTTTYICILWPNSCVPNLVLSCFDLRHMNISPGLLWRCKLSKHKSKLN